MKYSNLLILFMIALKCGADEEPTTVNYDAVENVTNSEVFSSSTTEGELTNISSSSQPDGSEITLINATDDNAVEVKKKEFVLPTPGRLVQQGTRMVKNIIGSLVKGVTQLNEPVSKDDAEKGDEPTTVNYSTVENGTNSEASNGSITEAPENLFDKWTQLPNIIKSTATVAYAINHFKNKEFGKLPLPRKLPGHRTRLVTNILGSLLTGLAKLKEPDSEEDYDELTTTINYSTVENVTDSEDFNGTTTEAPDDSAIKPPGPVNATNVKAVSPFRKKEFGKLPLPRKLPGQRTRLVTNIIGSLIKGLAQLKEPVSEEDDEPTTANYSTVDVTNCEVSNASTTEALDNRDDMGTPLPNVNISSSSESPATENTLIKVTDGNAVGPSKKKEFRILSIPGTLPQQGTRVVTNIIGSLLKGLP